jgi:hypothetical protein
MISIQSRRPSGRWVASRPQDRRYGDNARRVSGLRATETPILPATVAIMMTAA